MHGWVFLFLFLSMPGLALAERCTWIEDTEVIDYVTRLMELELGLQDWDVECDSHSRDREYMKKCWCEINRDRLTKIKGVINEVESRFPQLAGKKICFKQDNLTSINVWLSESKRLLGQCAETAASGSASKE